VSFGWGPDRSARAREQAVRDVVESGMPVVGAAAVWRVQAADLERWVAQAREDAPAGGDE